MIKKNETVLKLFILSLFLLGVVQEAKAFSTQAGSLSSQADPSYPQGRIEGKITTAKGEPIERVRVYALDKNCGNSTSGASSTTDAGGKYSINGLSPGTYYVSTDAQTAETKPSGYYINELWDGGNGVVECSKAASVTVRDGQAVYDINFSLEEGARIDGYITNTNGEPLKNICVYAHANTCSGGYWFRGEAKTDSNGYYSITGIPEGTCFITADASCRGKNTATYYVKGFWDGSTGTSSCENAAPIKVVKGQRVNDISFSLEAGGLVSGQVTAEGGGALSNICIRINNKKCLEGEFFGEALVTDDQGMYSAIIPAGTYYINTDASCSVNSPAGKYKNEYWDNVQGTIDCIKAEAITVNLSKDISGINFTLQVNTSTSTTTTIYLPPPPECSLDSECNDGLFCNGEETCLGGACASGERPCAESELCIENLQECRSFEKMTAAAVIKKISRPLILNKTCPWLAFIDETNNYFDPLQSQITITGAGKSYEGIDLDVSRNVIKIGILIFVPVCVESDATPGQWSVEIATDTVVADKPYRYIIEGVFEVK
ncbi:MAG: carboxypeptidase-like regulatory domain-containing protein [Pseudomonadota bacterium]